LTLTAEQGERSGAVPLAWDDEALRPTLLAVLTTLMLWPLAFLAGLARSRLDRSAVDDLAIELEQASSPLSLGCRLVRLGDPNHVRRTEAGANRCPHRGTATT
jgi:hypothetical protein